MIVRILGEGQFTVPDAHLDSLNAHDAQLTAALERDDAEAFHAALDEMLAEVRSSGDRLLDEELLPSDVILPSPDASLDEVRELVASDGLVPG
jgi:hypothetical protein